MAGRSGFGSTGEAAFRSMAGAIPRTLLMMAAITVAAASVPRLITLAALALLLNVKARWEETRLTQRFEGYADYAAHTPRFVPLRMPRSP